MNRLNRREALTLFGQGTLFLSLGNLTGCGKRPSKSGLRLQQSWVNDAEFIGYIVANGKGYYKNHGIENFVHIPGGAATIPDLVVNKAKAEIALTTPDNTMSFITRDKLPLKIIGAQYHTSPMGILSLKKNKIGTPQDLIGKRVAVPQVNVIMFEAFLKLNGIKLSDVTLVPYNYDPGIIFSGESNAPADATLDFVPNVKHTIDVLIAKHITGNMKAKDVEDVRISKGWEVNEMVLAKVPENGKDFVALPMLMDTVVVTEQYLENEKNRETLKKWFVASREGWRDVFEDPEGSVQKHLGEFMKETQRSADLEVAFCRKEKDYMLPVSASGSNAEAWKSIFEITDDNIAKTVDSLRRAGIKDADAKYFDASILNELAKSETRKGL